MLDIISETALDGFSPSARHPFRPTAHIYQGVFRPNYWWSRRIVVRTFCASTIVKFFQLTKNRLIYYGERRLRLQLPSVCAFYTASRFSPSRKRDEESSFPLRYHPVEGNVAFLRRTLGTICKNGEKSGVWVHYSATRWMNTM